MYVHIPVYIECPKSRLGPNRQKNQFGESIQMQLCTFEDEEEECYKLQLNALTFLPDTIEKVQSTVL